MKIITFIPTYIPAEAQQEHISALLKGELSRNHSNPKTNRNILNTNEHPIMEGMQGKRCERTQNIEYSKDCN